MGRIGASDFTVAKMLTDDENGVTYDKPVALRKRLMKIDYEPSTGRANQEADDQIVETMTARGETKVSVNLTELTLSEKALLLGQTIENGVRIAGKDDIPPYFAVMFRSLKSNRKYRYVKLFKVQFSEMKESAETKKQTPVFQNATLEGIGIQRLFDGKDIAEADADEPTFTQSIGANWFNSGDVVFDTQAPVISDTSPANNATDIAVDTKQFSWVFSKAILPASVIKSNFFVIKDSDGSLVEGTLTQSEDKKTVIFTAAANFTAATIYRAIATADIKDTSYNSLAANDIRKFTTE
ncbi:MAG: Ig-like domain-containing protein [Bacillota bacterium]|nr:Ig-like domain-containing protein [Bacillota bacterium]